MDAMDLSGRRFGNYRVLRQLGQGGFGAVYVAEHPMMARQAAVKVLSRSLADDPEYLSRFFNEARAASAIRHPNIVEVFDVGVTGDGLPYILMELLEGESLRQRLEHVGPLPLRTAVSFARQSAGALWAAHRAGVVHRDFKPDNVFIVADERIRLLDFGIAKLTGVPTSNVVQTEAGRFLGSPRYTSPEQWHTSPSVDHRTDIYALGAVLFEMLLGTPLFPGDNVFELRDLHLHAPVPPLRQARPEVPEELEQLVRAMLAKDPAERPPDMGEVGAALDQIARTLSRAASPGGAARTTTEPPTFPPRTLITSQKAAPPPGPAGRTRLLAGGAAAVLLMTGIVLIAARLGGARRDPNRSPATAPSLAHTDVERAAPPPVATHTSPPPEPAVAQAPPPLAPATVSWRITSRPPGALVVDADRNQPLGSTPLQLVLPLGSQPRRLRISLRGHTTQVVAVPLQGDLDREVVLERASHRRQPRPASDGDIVL